MSLTPLLAAQIPWDRLPENAPAIFTLLCVVVCFGLLAFTTLTPDVILVGSVVVLLATGVLTTPEALAGFANEGVVTIAILFIIAAAVQETGGVDWIARNVLGRPKTLRAGLARMVVPVAALSAFLNNTPLVAMMIPAVTDYSRKSQIPASKLMMPLAFAASLGGVMTLIGTSTNLVVQGMLIESTGRGMRMFDISWVGVPVAIVGVSYLIFIAPWLLPNRKAALSTLDDPREYTVEMQIMGDSHLPGKSIEAAGLRHLPGLFLAEIHRDGVSIPAVSPQEILLSGDRLLFVGAMDSVKELHRIRGLIPATDDVFQLNSPRPQRCLIEAVVSNTCPLLGKTIRESRFRSQYNAVVVAVARNGERLRQKLGDIELKAGDVLLVEAHPSFAEQHRNSRDFFLVSAVSESSPPRHDRALLAIGLLLAMVIVVAIELMPMMMAGLITAGILLLSRCISLERARRCVSWDVLVAIAASLALGTALEKSRAARMIAESITNMADGNVWWSLVLVYVGTVIVTEIVSNNAAVALMFPFAMSVSKSLGVDYMPFVIAVMIAGSSSFATPIGYQTNLMVYGPGGYRFRDYTKVGLPLDVLVAIVALALIPLFFPLTKS